MAQVGGHRHRPGLTVVTPVRNGEGHLARIATAILRELSGIAGASWAVVDDGSQDGTSTYLDELEACHKGLIRTYRTEGLGSGPARNVGLVTTSTHWVTFVDVDDGVEPGSLRAWLAVAEELNPDVLITGSPHSLSGRRARRWTGPPRLLRPQERWTAELLRDWIPGGKVYRTEHLRAEGLQYSDVPEGQDVAFFVAAVLSARSVGACPTLPRYVYGPPTNTDADRAPRRPEDTFAEFGRALGLVRGLRLPPKTMAAVASPLHAGACAILLRSLAFAQSREAREELVRRFQQSGTAGSLEPGLLRALDRRDLALCLAAQVAARSGDPTAASLGRAYRWSQRRRNRRRAALAQKCPEARHG